MEYWLKTEAFVCLKNVCSCIWDKNTSNLVYELNLQHSCHYYQLHAKTFIPCFPVIVNYTWKTDNLGITV
jgi:hypothetical protein